MPPLYAAQPERETTEMLFGEANVLNKLMAESCHRTVRSFCEDSGTTQADIADLLKINEKTLNGMLKEHTPMHVTLPIRLQRALGLTAPVEEVCRLSGGIFISVPKPIKRSTKVLLQASANAAKEAGQAIDVALRAIADGEVSPEEKKRCRKEITEAICSFDALLRLLEAVPESETTDVSRLQ